MQTKFPDENTRTADFGFFTRNTNPGNCSGLYSVLLWVLASFVRDTGLPKEVVATIFCTFKEVFAILKIFVVYFEFLRCLKNAFLKHFLPLCFP